MAHIVKNFRILGNQPKRVPERPGFSMSSAFLCFFFVIICAPRGQGRRRITEIDRTRRTLSRTSATITIGLMQKYPPIFKKMFLNDVALLWMRGFHAYDTASVS